MLHVWTLIYGFEFLNCFFCLISFFECLPVFVSTIVVNKDEYALNAACSWVVEICLMMSGNYDRVQGASPCFSPLGSPDFLSSLSHMGDSLIAGDGKPPAGSQPIIDGQLRQPRTPSDGQLSGGGGHLRHPPDQPPAVMHPRTPLDGQMCQNPRTPIEAQMMHPPTPMDGQFSVQQMRTPLEGQLMHPRTPLDGQLCNYPHTPADGQASHPRTPMDGSQHPVSTESARPSSSDPTSLRPTPGTPGSSPQTPSAGGRSYATSSSCMASNTVRTGCSTLSHSSVNSAASCSTDSSRMPTAATMSAASASDTDILGANFAFDAAGFGDSDSRAADSLDVSMKHLSTCVHGVHWTEHEITQPYCAYNKEVRSNAKMWKKCAQVICRLCFLTGKIPHTTVGTWQELLTLWR